jgi:hypothetical protein
MGQVFLRLGAWWGLRILTGTENVIICSSIRRRVRARSVICREPPGSALSLVPPITSGYQLVGVADFNRDGKPDYLLFNPSSRRTAIWYLNNNVRISAAFGRTLPAGYTVAAP